MGRVLPILFNTDMVRAILDGRKTVTRRVVKFPVNKFTNKEPDMDRVSVCSDSLRGDEVHFHEEPHYCIDIKPPCHSGDILYVRETWSTIKNADGTHKKYVYKASDTYPFGEKGYIMKFRWYPSIHMPKEVARILLKVTDVRVERFLQIPDDSWMKEGIYHNWRYHGWTWKNNPKEEDCYYSPHDAFRSLWDSTLSKQDLDKYGSKNRPWVWVIEFERCEKPKGED